MWRSKEDAVICLIDPPKLGADPFLLGIALADCVRHGAKAYAACVNVSEQEAERRIWSGLDAERESPTDAPVDLSHPRNTN